MIDTCVNQAALSLENTLGNESICVGSQSLGTDDSGRRKLGSRKSKESSTMPNEICLQGRHQGQRRRPGLFDNNTGVLPTHSDYRQHEESCNQPRQRLDMDAIGRDLTLDATTTKSSLSLYGKKQPGSRRGGGGLLFRSFTNVFKRKNDSRTSTTTPLRKSHSSTVVLRDSDPVTTLLQQQRNDSFRSVPGSMLGRNASTTTSSRGPRRNESDLQRNQSWGTFSPPARDSICRQRRRRRRSKREQELFLCPLGNEQAGWESPGGPTTSSSPLSSAEFTATPSRDSTRFQSMMTPPPPLSSPNIQISRSTAMDRRIPLQSRNVVRTSSVSSRSGAVQSTPSIISPIMNRKSTSGHFNQRSFEPSANVAFHGLQTLVSPARSPSQHRTELQVERTGTSTKVSTDPSFGRNPPNKAILTCKLTTSSECETEDYQSKDQQATAKNQCKDEPATMRHEHNGEPEISKQSPDVVKQDKQQASMFDDDSHLKGTFRVTPDREKCRTTEIEIAPGVYKPLRGSDETWKAIETGNITQSSCFFCTHDLHCLDDAEFVLCPVCRVVGPVKANLLGFEYGVGLGVKPDQMRRWMREIERERG